MLIMLLLIAMIGAALVHLFRKYILRIEEPNIEELWAQLENQDWFQQFLRDPDSSSYIDHLREHGLLKDAHYVQKLLSHEGSRNGFIHYINSKKDEAQSKGR